VWHPPWEFPARNELRISRDASDHHTAVLTEGSGCLKILDASPGQIVIRTAPTASPATWTITTSLLRGGEDMGIDHRGLHIGVPEQLLNGADVGSRIVGGLQNSG
jgi:hypothetical protein